MLSGFIRKNSLQHVHVENISIKSSINDYIKMQSHNCKPLQVQMKIMNQLLVLVMFSTSYNASGKDSKLRKRHCNNSSKIQHGSCATCKTLTANVKKKTDTQGWKETGSTFVPENVSVRTITPRKGLTWSITHYQRIQAKYISLYSFQWKGHIVWGLWRGS